MNTAVNGRLGFSAKAATTVAAAIGLLAGSLATPPAMAQDKPMDKMDMSRYAGPVYAGPPALDVTSALVKAGGGAKKYSTAKALTSMVGEKLVGAEVDKLTKQYGADKVTQWLATFDFAVDDALKIATDAGVKLPKPAKLMGDKLASGLVMAGLDKDGAFQIEFLLDKAVSHKIHVQVMDDIDKKFSSDIDGDYHKISNQAFYDLAQALGATTVKLSDYH